MTNETKEVKFKCRFCGFEITEKYAPQVIVPTEKKCPSCNKIQLAQVIPSYFEQMKEKYKK